MALALFLFIFPACPAHSGLSVGLPEILMGQQPHSRTHKAPWHRRNPAGELKGRAGLHGGRGLGVDFTVLALLSGTVCVFSGGSSGLLSISHLYLAGFL